MKQAVKLIPLLFIGVSSSLAAAELPTESSGWETQQWLELQRSGAVASAKSQTISGDVSASIYERYVRSFTYKIPEWFLKDETNAASSGGDGYSAE